MKKQINYTLKRLINIIINMVGMAILGYKFNTFQRKFPTIYNTKADFKAICKAESRMLNRILKK